MDPHRLFLFHSGAILGTFTNDDHEGRAVWSKSLVVEPSGECFTAIVPSDTTTLTTEKSKDTSQRVQATLLAHRSNHSTPFTDRAQQPYQAHHRLSRFCSGNFRSQFHQAISFRNTYYPRPTLVRHQPTTKYFGACQISCMNSSTASYPAPVCVVHWPSVYTAELCEAMHDGAIRVRSMDGRACLVLAPHRQLFQLHFPAAVDQTSTENDSKYREKEAAVAAADAAEPDTVFNAHVNHVDPVDAVDHVGIVQLVWVRQCPKNLFKVLKIAQETASRLVQRKNGEYFLIQDQKAEECVECVEEKQPSATVGLSSITLPMTTTMENRVTWSTATDVLGGENNIGAESVVLCSSMRSLPQQRRVAVEWTSAATYWLHGGKIEDVDGIENGVDDDQIVIGCLLHDTNTFITCTTMKRENSGIKDQEREIEKVEKMPRAATKAWIKVYRANMLGEHVMMASTMHIPSAEESSAVKHMLDCVAHCRLTKLEKNKKDEMEQQHVAGVCGVQSGVKNEREVLTALVRETSTVENVGTFTCYKDRRLRGIFEDRTIVRIDRHWSTVDIIRTDGKFVQCLVENPSSSEKKYVRLLLEFGQWSEMSPLERHSRAVEEREYCQRVVTEADRIRRFLCMDKMDRYTFQDDTCTKTIEVNETTQIQSRNNKLLVPEVCKDSVLNMPILRENPSDWLPLSLADAVPVPGRDIMERYIAKNLSATQNFLDREFDEKTAFRNKKNVSLESNRSSSYMY